MARICARKFRSLLAAGVNGGFFFGGGCALSAQPAQHQKIGTNTRTKHADIARSSECWSTGFAMEFVVRMADGGSHGTGEPVLKASDEPGGGGKTLLLSKFPTFHAPQTMTASRWWFRSNFGPPPFTPFSAA